ncbi:Opacity protein antigens [Hartmannibacter diazotrophicus]|uniref:Opacity protein antigens n=1 Tax=Hartmannibacter diazotrophicus TaxID=1482074 RepID=A0A2C9DA72_9HYPH|nr:outer membrane beta-barrel protein [Hartmannibacter diazotrophicus]SON57038.1 Opacity protein antigens [Hartmannibacter diazotrophicus]
MSRKTTLFTIAGTTALAAALLSGQAYAADISEPIPAAPTADPYVAPTKYDWSGAYVGGEVGYGFGSYGVNGTAGKQNFDKDGFVGGVYGGYNYMVTPDVLLGAEADLGFGSSATFTYGGTPTKAESSVAGSIRGRVGYAFDNVLVYGTTGVALGQGKASFNGGSDENTHVGWVVGAGVEAALTDNIIARAEYTYTDMDKKTYSVGGQSEKADLDGSVISLGLGYKF